LFYKIIFELRVQHTVLPELNNMLNRRLSQLVEIKWNTETAKSTKVDKRS